ncbi:MAG: hypothetical protein HY335_07415 [Deinococcus sp.]|nr:hypothetical protein [Deinococcus sp.]
MSTERFVQCQRCGRVYQLPSTYSHLQVVLGAQGEQRHCYATLKPTFDQVRPCESQEFREITATEARVWRGPLYFVVPVWYQPEYHALLAHTEIALLEASSQPATP